MSKTGSSIVILKQVDSTNNYAMAKVHEGLAKHGNAFFSPHQTQGKGQRGKVWQSMENQNIALSIVLEPLGININQQFEISVVAALGGLDFFSSYAGDESSIKWPNDIYWRDRKAGGILIENVFQGKEWRFCIIGIGINVNQGEFAAELPNPVSMKQITGKEFNPESLARELHQSILYRYNQLKEINKLRENSEELEIIRRNEY
jgi:BirA family biotin operon repressor/biotin-[acetyl-CoA-carboxylase] ligase